MRHRNLRSLFWLILGITLLLGEHAVGQTRLGLHVTQEELNIWKQRAASGPYKTKGDVSTNSPGDWDRITSAKNSFMGNPSAHRFNGPTKGQCVRPGNSSYPVLQPHIMQAAFYALVMNDATVRTAVRNELIAQASVPSLNFNDSTTWCAASAAADQGPLFQISAWLAKYLHSYDYIRSSLSATDRNTLDTWFRNAANFYKGTWTKQRREVWIDPDNNNYAFTSQGNNMCTANGIVAYYGGPLIYDAPRRLQNRSSEVLYFTAAAGILLNDATLMNYSKRVWREFLQYGIYPNAVSADFDRWSDRSTTATLGWRYTGATLGNLAAVADLFGRLGDLSLFDYSTSNGQCGTAGGPKTLRIAIREFQSYVTHELKRYGTNQAANAGNSNYLIDSIEELDGGSASVRDAYPVMANLYYRDPYISQRYLRQASGSPPYPSGPETGGYEPWSGATGKWPALLLLFGNMEGKVWPYPGQTVQPPTNLHIVGN